jgi:hypothetical protein
LVVAALILLVAVVGCKPRGESRSVREILSESSQAYRKSFDGEPLPERVSSRLPELSDALSRLTEDADLERKKALADSIVEHLRALVVTAGYTTRPALGELIDQFGALAEADSGSVVADGETVSLLVSRTYYLLASELKGIRFQLGDRELRK